MLACYRGSFLVFLDKTHTHTHTHTCACMWAHTHKHAHTHTHINSQKYNLYLCVRVLLDMKKVFNIWFPFFLSIPAWAPWFFFHAAYYRLLVLSSFFFFWRGHLFSVCACRPSPTSSYFSWCDFEVWVVVTTEDTGPSLFYLRSFCCCKHIANFAAGIGKSRAAPSPTHTLSDTCRREWVLRNMKYDMKRFL